MGQVYREGKNCLSSCFVADGQVVVWLEVQECNSYFVLVSVPDGY
jgi:hypothetical protein